MSLVEVVPPPGVAGSARGDSLSIGALRDAADSNTAAVFIRSAVVSY